MPARLSAWVLTAGLLAHAAALAEPLPSDPRLTAGALANGVQYRIKPHAHPPGRVSLRLHLPVGSLNEDDDERGYAHLLEHLAFAGSDNFPDGRAVPHFESLGLTLGRHQNAFTGLDHTVYTLDLPDSGERTLTDGLTFLADVLGRLHLPEARVAQEREVVLAEMRTYLGPHQRLMDRWFRRVAHGTRAADRPTIGDPKSVAAAERSGPEAFYRRWYTTGGATVVVVGDVDAAAARALVEAAFGDLPTAPPPKRPDAGTIAHEAAFAMVSTDSDFAGAHISLMHVGPPRVPIATAAAFRRDLVESLAVFAFNRRLGDRIAAGSVHFHDGEAAAGAFFSAGWSLGVSASGELPHWRTMLGELAAEVHRFRTTGISERELDDARAAFLASVRHYARIEHTIPSPVLAQQVVTSVHEQEPLMSAPQVVELVERFLPDVAVAEVSAVFRDGFDPSRMVVTLTTTADKRAPFDHEVLAAAVAAFDMDVADDDEGPGAAILPEFDAEPATVTGGTLHDATGVHSAWLSNGTRVHHRYMDHRPHEVAVRVTLAGGVIEEDAETRAHTLAAAGVLRRFATRSLDSGAIRSLLVGRMLSLDAYLDDDALTLTLDATRAELERGMHVLHLVLSEPLLEPVAFAQWRREQIDNLQAASRNPAASLALLLQTARFPADDPRWRPLAAAEVGQLELARVQAWLDAFVRRAPLEVAVVGDIDRDAALALAAKYFGSLPERPRIADVQFERPAPPAGEIAAVTTIPSATPQAVALVGFAGADSMPPGDMRALAQAARILSIRLNRRIREEEGLVYSIGAVHRTSPFPGYGTFTSGATVDPANAERLADLIGGMFAAFAADGPTGDEVAVALRQFEIDFGEDVQEPLYWAHRYSRYTYDRRPAETVDEIFDAYRGLTADDIHAVFARYHGAGTDIRYIVLPSGR